MEEHSCTICGALMEGPDPYVLYHSEKTDEESYACPKCALDYFSRYADQIKSIPDKDLLAVLMEIFEDAVKLVKQKDQAAE